VIGDGFGFEGRGFFIDLIIVVGQAELWTASICIYMSYFTFIDR
jgi:hypothetical protein